MGFAIPIMAADPSSAAMMEGVAKGMVQGAMNAMGGMAPIMATPSGGGGMPGVSADPAAMAAMQGKAGSDPIGDFFDDLFGGGEPDMADPSSFLGARGGGAMPGADMAGMQGLPVVPGPNGQAMLMTGQGALPLFMTQQGPMAMTPGGAVPLQALAAASPQAQQALQARAVQAQALQAQALSDAVAKRMAMASSPSPFSGSSSFAPAKKAPVALSAPAPTAAPATPAPVVQADTAPTTAKSDPKLQRKAGVGTRIGTTGTGDGN